MKLYSPPFAKSLRRAVRARIRASPALKREYRRAGRRRLASTHVTWGAQVLFTPMLFAFVGTLAGTLPGPDVALALISLLAFLMVLTREAALLRYLYRSPDLHALSLLPLTPREIFRWQLGGYLSRVALYARSSCFLVVFLASCFIPVSRSGRHWSSFPSPP